MESGDHSSKSKGGLRLESLKKKKNRSRRKEGISEKETHLGGYTLPVKGTKKARPLGSRWAEKGVFQAQCQRTKIPFPGPRARAAGTSLEVGFEETIRDELRALHLEMAARSWSFGCLSGRRIGEKNFL